MKFQKVKNRMRPIKRTKKIKKTKKIKRVKMRMRMMKTVTMMKMITKMMKVVTKMMMVVTTMTNLKPLKLQKVLKKVRVLLSITRSTFNRKSYCFFVSSAGTKKDKKSSNKEKGT